jgi:hypothetical protein
MSKDSEQQKTTTAIKKFIVVARAEDEDLARQYYKVLRYYRVPAHIGSKGGEHADPYDTTISVPEKYYDKAYKLISERMPGESFVDMIFRPLDEFEEMDMDQENPNQAA